MDRDKKSELRIDPDFSPEHMRNREVASELGLRYDQRRRVYVDADGCAVLDRFGQQLG